jgi:NAD(P)-dependent dehydrogenase (short-subunit alcohol dehydrogenase family)
MTPTKIALITGGASGIGLATAEALAQRGGWQLFLVDKDAGRGRAAANKIPRASFFAADVTDYGSLAEAFRAIFESSQRLDFVFANAGIAMTAPVSVDSTKPPPTPDMTMIDVNLCGAINTSTLALYYLAKSGHGSNLIITASSAGFYASAVSPAYSASKHGVIGWTRSIAPAAKREHGIRVNAVCPGIARTNILPDAVYEVSCTVCSLPVEFDAQRSDYRLLDVPTCSIDARLQGSRCSFNDSRWRGEHRRTSEHWSDDRGMRSESLFPGADRVL